MEATSEAVKIQENSSTTTAETSSIAKQNAVTSDSKNESEKTNSPSEEEMFLGLMVSQLY